MAISFRSTVTNIADVQAAFPEIAPVFLGGYVNQALPHFEFVAVEQDPLKFNRVANMDTLFAAITVYDRDGRYKPWPRRP